MEKAPTSVGRNELEGDTTTTRAHNNTRKLFAGNGGRGEGQGGCGVIIIHQVLGGRGMCFNRPLYMSSIQNFNR